MAAGTGNWDEFVRNRRRGRGCQAAAGAGGGGSRQGDGGWPGGQRLARRMTNLMRGYPRRRSRVMADIRPRSSVAQSTASRTYSAIRIYWRGHAVHAAWPALVRAAPVACSLVQVAHRQPAVRARTRRHIARPPRADDLARGVTHLSASGSRFPRPQPIRRPCWQMPAVRCPRTRCCQRYAQGPTPETRSTVICVIYPGGGLSTGGKRTSGPR